VCFDSVFFRVRPWLSLLLPSVANLLLPLRNAYHYLPKSCKTIVKLIKSYC